MKGVAQTNTELLVTDAERVAKLHAILGSRFTNHGHLLLPTFRQYEALSSDDGLLALAKEMCRWIGFKPRQLQVSFGPLHNHQYFTVSSDTIIINKLFQSHPLVTGGIVAYAVTQFVLQNHHYSPNTRFIEVSTIEMGLGLWIINAFQPRRTQKERIYHMLYGNWLQLEGLQLDGMTASEYLRAFTIFTSTNRLFPEEYGKGVSKRSHHLLPSTPSTTKIIPLPEPTATLDHLRQANMLWTKIILLSLSAALTVLVGLFLWFQHSQPTTHDQTRDAEALRVIKASLGDCIQKASEQQSTYNPNDLFMARQIDATKTRCESLRNQYNDAVTQYEANYTNK